MRICSFLAVASLLIACGCMHSARTASIGMFQSGGVGDPNHPSASDKAGNLVLMRDAARNASKEGAEVLVFPELYLTGYNIGQLLYSESETKNGPSMQEVASIAKENSLSIVYGFPESSGNDLYNSVNVVDADGSLAFTYRKTHLFGNVEKDYFTPGTVLGPVFTVSNCPLKLAVIICYDVEFPEAVRTLALQGVDLVLVPTANMEPYMSVNTILVPARAIENEISVVYVNRMGSENGTSDPNLTFVGTSTAIGPYGEILERMSYGKQELAVVDVSPKPDIQYYLPDRQVCDYTNLCKPLPGSWCTDISPTPTHTDTSSGWTDSSGSSSHSSSSSSDSGWTDSSGSSSHSSSSSSDSGSSSCDGGPGVLFCIMLVLLGFLAGGLFLAVICGFLLITKDRHAHNEYYSRAPAQRQSSGIEMGGDDKRSALL